MIEEIKNNEFMNAFGEAGAVACIAELLALECGISSLMAKRIRTAAYLHDIGKIMIPASIINKPGSLDALELELIKVHTLFGAWLLKNVKGNFGEVVRTTAHYHHEWVDSSGYWGKCLSEFPVYVEITALADVFVACAVERPYKQAWPVDDTLAFISDRAGAQFTPRMAEIFTSLVQRDERIPAIINNTQANILTENACREKKGGGGNTAGTCGREKCGAIHKSNKDNSAMPCQVNESIAA
ncbi:MAG: HD domain-containing protein [Defluviitaleaceae bacterium]|nr:HD domain-containing protein [Defluviitaleaceae bacterium]